MKKHLLPILFFVAIMAFGIAPSIPREYLEYPHECTSLQNDTTSGASDTIRLPRRAQQSTEGQSDNAPNSIQMPEAPITDGFAPTIMSDIEAANPTSGINIITPPTANQNGSANLQFPFIMPPARNNMQPQVALFYNSDSSDGWAGEGWNISIPVITVDTRWGVPSYDTDYETETYLLNGEMLCTAKQNGDMTVAHRNELLERTDTIRQFFTRHAGDFNRIIRIGSSPDNYRWEITDTRGTKYYYGSTENSRLCASTAIPADDIRPIAEWHIDKAEEIHGDYITYSYSHTNGFWGESVPTHNITVQQITAGNAEHPSTPHTVVNFISRNRENVKTNNARYGFVTCNSNLLDSISIVYRGSLLRSYKLNYTTGDFKKTLLSNIIHYDDCSNIASTHDMTYHTENHKFSSPESFTGHTDYRGNLFNLMNLNDAFNAPSALGGTSGKSLGTSVYAGVGPTNAKADKTGTAGVNVAISNDTNDGVSTIIDINGDGIPDKVYKAGNGVKYRPGIAVNDYIRYGSELDVVGINRFLHTSTLTFSGGAQASLGAGGVTYMRGQSFNTSTTKTTDYFIDINHDGLPDFVSNGKVYFNHIENRNGDLIPTFSLNSSDTPNQIVTTASIADGIYSSDPTETDTLTKYSPRIDMVRVWTAPFDGSVLLRGSVHRIIPSGNYDESAYDRADNLRVAIQMNDSEIWANSIAKNDSTTYSYYTTVSVNGGDKIYFRVQPGSDDMCNGDFDQIVWDPMIQYTSANETMRNLLDGSNNYEYSLDVCDVVSAHNDYHAINSRKVIISGEMTLPVLSDGLNVRIVTDNGQLLSDKQVLASPNSRTFNYLDSIVINADTTTFIKVQLYSPSNLEWSKIRFQPDLYLISGSDTVRKEKLIPEMAMFPKTIFYPELMVLESGTYSYRLITHNNSLQDIPCRMTIKGKRGLLASINCNSANNLPNSIIPFTINRRDTVCVELFFESDITQSNLVRPFIGNITYPTGTTIHSEVGIYCRTEPDIFGHHWKGWGAFAYNNRASTSTQINHQLINNSINSLDSTVFINMNMPVFQLSPKVEGSVARWEGPHPNIYCSLDTMSAGRLSVQDVQPYNPVATATDAYAVATSGLENGRAIGITQISKQTGQTSQNTAGVSWGSATLNQASGSGKTKLTMTDMNGDGYPDIVGETKIQYTNNRGGQSSNVYTDSSMGIESLNSSTTINLGGNPTVSTSTNTKHTTGSKSASQNSESNSETTKNSLPFSLSATIGNSDTTTISYADFNGDGLPDKIIKDDDNIYVSLNKGYGFYSPVRMEHVIMPNGHGKNFGASAGFDIANGSFSGGLNLSLYTNNSNIDYVDINGDGLPDMLKSGPSEITMYLNLGDRFDEEPLYIGINKSVNKSSSTSLGGNVAFTTYIPAGLFLKIAINPGVSTATSIQRPEQQFMDIDGDGFIDYVESHNENELIVRFSQLGKVNRLQSVTNSLGGVFYIDYDRSEATYDHPGGKWVMSELSVDYGLGEATPLMKTKFEYTNGKYDRREREFLGFGRVCQKQLDTEANDSTYRSVTDTYDVSSYYVKGNQLSSEVSDGAGNVLTKESYLYTNYNVRYVRNNYSFSLVAANVATDNGSIYSPMSFTENIMYENGVAKIMFQKRFKYDVSGPNPHFGALSQYEYSDKGNMFAGDSGEYDYQQTYTYSHNASHYIVNRLASLTRSSRYGANYAATFLEYNDEHEHLLPSIIAKRNNNDVTRYRYQYNKNGTIHKMYLPAYRTRDNGSCDTLSYTYFYEDTLKTYISKISDSHDYHSHYENYDYRYGVPRVHRDINNCYTTTEIDGLGRTTKIVAPMEYLENNDTVYTIRFSYSQIASQTGGSITHPAYAVSQNYDVCHEGNPIETVTLVDGFGRVAQVKKDGVIRTNSNDHEEVMIVSGRQYYDAFGRIKAEYYPVTETKSQSWADMVMFNTLRDINLTRNVFDVLDRPVSQILADGTSIDYQYNVTKDRSNNVVRTLVTDALGHQSATFTNGSGLTTKTTQWHNNSEINTLYTYDGVQRLIEVRDADNNVTTSAYDMLDRLTTVSHPASGTTTYTYNDMGNVKSKTTENLAGKNSVITYDYDLERLTAIHYPDHPENDVHYFYGSENDPLQHTAGRISYILDGTGATSFEYDQLGNVIHSKRTIIVPIKGIYTFNSTWTYDSFGRVLTMTYPDNESIEYSYDLGGQLVSVTGRKDEEYTYVSSITYNKHGQKLTTYYGNGLHSTSTYDSQTLRPISIGLGSSNLTSLQVANEYSYDQIGNITRVVKTLQSSRTGGGMTHLYSYDDLNRLVSATGNYSRSNPLPSQSATYSLEMGYDDMYRVTSKRLQVSRRNIQTAGYRYAGYSLNYAYSPDNGKRFQLAEISEDSIYSDKTPTGRSYMYKKNMFEYDANGNVVYENQARRHQNGEYEDKTAEIKYMWDEENRLMGISENGYVSHYIYDANGERTLKIHAGNEGYYYNSNNNEQDIDSTMHDDYNPVFTIYVSPYFVVDQNGDCTKHIFVNNERIASKYVNIYENMRPSLEPKVVIRGSFSEDDYIDKMDTLQMIHKSVYDYLGVPFKGIQRSARSLLEGEDEDIQAYGIFDPQPSESQAFFYHKDHLGGSLCVTDKDAQIVERSEYIPYGEVFVDNIASDAEYETPYKFTGKEYDEETGLYYFGARYLHPKYATWLSVDPFAMKYPNVSPYAYCEGNPIKYVDPDGRKIIPGLSRGINANGYGTFEPYISHKNFIAAMQIVGKTTFGKKFIGAFLEVGQSLYGVSGTGRNSNFTFIIQEIMQPTSIAQFNLIGNSAAKSWWEFDQETGELIFVLKIDVNGKSIASLVETICHEIGLHNGCLDEIAKTFQVGGIDAVNKYRQDKGDKDHIDLINCNTNNIGVKTYNSMREELSRNSDELKKTFENEERKYQETY